MADKRMFSKKVLYAPDFFRLSAVVKYLYIEICLECDDDGFCPWPDRVLRNCGADRADLQALVDAGYLLDFEEVVVVTHWRLHNTLRKDRIKTAAFPQLAKKLWVLEDGTYSTVKTGECVSFSNYKNGGKPGKEENPEFWYVNGLPKGKEEKRKEEKRTEKKRREKSRKELLAAAGLTDVQLSTLELIMLPDGLVEGLREVGTEGDVYRKLMDWWKEKVERQKMEAG